MPLITEYYGIDRPVPFADVDVFDDNRLFVDPHMVRLRPGPEPFGHNAVWCLDSFLSEVVRCVLDGSTGAAEHGEQLLQQFREPPETRLGMCAAGAQGHGGAAMIGTAIWEALVGELEALLRVGVLRHLEELPLFVNGVDRDITSDLTTRIIFETLGRFTESMIATYPELASDDYPTITVTRTAWDRHESRWHEVSLTLPQVASKPLLLVPKGWVRASLLMSADRFYGVSVLGYAQAEQAVVQRDGRVIRPTKRSLKAQPGLQAVRPTNRQVTLRAVHQSAENLIETFTHYVDDRVGPDVEAA